MSEQTTGYEEHILTGEGLVGFILKNGMKISLYRPNPVEGTVMGENLELVVEHPDGLLGRIRVQCSGSTNGYKYVDFYAREGQPLDFDGDIYLKQAPSFHPDNLESIKKIVHKTASRIGHTYESTVAGVFSSFRLNLI